jgi:hypothetical protein
VSNAAVISSEGTTADATKEQTMDRFKLAVAMMAVTESHWGPGDTQGRRREFTADELDVLAHWRWHLPDLAGIIAACARVVQSPWRARASKRLDPMPLPSAAAPSEG